MENPGRLEENLEALSKEIAALKYAGHELEKNETRRMEGRLGQIQGKENELDGLQRQLSELSQGFHANNLNARLKINRKVIECLKGVKVLKQGISANSEVVESLLSELIIDKPKRFSSENLRSFTSNFSTTLVSGQDGNVYKGQLPNGTPVAVKVLTEKDVIETIFMAEVRTMFKTSHRNLIQLFGYCFDEKFKAFVYEYMENGSLDQVLTSKHCNIEWEKLYDILIQTAKGLSYLHDGFQEGIIHHCIKPSNVLLSSNLSPKISNFAVARPADRDVTNYSKTRGQRTAYYSAPEMWQGSQVTYKCDIYSFGMMMFDLLESKRQKKTKRGLPCKVVWDKYENGHLDEFIDECGVGDRDKAKILCMVGFWCAQYRPQNRPSMSTVVKMLEMEIPISTPPNPFLPYFDI